MELSRTLKFRNIWIGAAMVWIVFYHSGFWIGPEWFMTLKSIGYGGVDICLFASGVGCYFSLEKNSDILKFLKRRVRRLAPAWLCFIIPWLLWRTRVSQLPVWAILGNLLGIQTLVSWESHFNWYIGGLVVYYLAIPYLKRLTDSCGALGQDVLAGVFLTAVSIPFWEAGSDIVILSRLPVLYAGLVWAKYARQGYALKRKDYLAAGMLALAGLALLLLSLKRYPDYLWARGLYWYPFALIVPGCCLVLSALAEKAESYGCLRWINRFLDAVGTYSFELYLVHLFLYEGLMPGITERFANIPGNLLWLATLPVVVCGTWLLNRAAAFAEKTAGSLAKRHGK